MSSILPFPRLTKHKKLINILEASEDLIPINDLDAYTKYTDYHSIYNRLELAEWQGLPCGPMPIEPHDDDYPVIIKPIINLYGLSLNCHKINNRDEFYNYWLDNGFWMKYLAGNSTSSDVIVRNGEVVWSCTFKGYIGDQPGIYNHWKLDNHYKLSNNEQKLIKEKLAGYSGIINIESIQGYIIEAHLRMGDLDHLVEINVLRALIKYYSTDIWELDTDFKPQKIYLVPVFVGPDDEFHLNEKEIQINAIGCISYQIDSDTTAHPPTGRRVVLLTCNNLKIGVQSRDKILEENRLIGLNKTKHNKCIIQ